MPDGREIDILANRVLGFARNFAGPRCRPMAGPNYRLRRDSRGDVPPSQIAMFWDHAGHASRQEKELLYAVVVKNNDATWDVFISHASEDKDVVRPLTAALRSAGVTVWLDESELLVGHSLREQIDRGLSQSRYGVVVLSAAFFAKDWPKLELGALLPRAGRLLPVWHGIDERYLMRVAPTLVDIYATSTAKGIQAVSADIANALRCALKAEAASTPSPSFDLDHFVARYRAHGTINDSLGRECVDAEIMSISFRPGIEQLDTAIARSSFDRETAMVIGLLLGRHVAHEDNILAARVLADLLRNPYGRVRYRAALALQRRYSDPAALSGSPERVRAIVRHSVEEALKTEENDEVVGMLGAVLRTLGN